jgi:putative ATP-dependent endonuclease of OLD family
MGDRLYQWPGGCSEKHVISAIPDDKLIELLTNDEDGKTGYRLRSLADRLGIEKKDIASIEAALAAQMKTLKELIIEAASGSTVGAPDKDVAKAWKKHAQDWFKSEEGGEELAKKMVACGAWPTIQAKLLPLVNAVLFYAKRPTISGLTL